MKGAREFAYLFETGQYGQIYIVSGRHARGRTFRIFVLPEGEEAKGNGKNNPPLNASAIEVYGVIAGNPGWTESYGWKEKGPWCEDFYQLAESFRMQKEHEERLKQATCEEVERENDKKKKRILSDYKPQYLPQ